MPSRRDIRFRNCYVAHAFVVYNDCYSMCDVFEIFYHHIYHNSIRIDDFHNNAYPASATNFGCVLALYYFYKMYKWHIILFVD